MAAVAKKQMEVEKKILESKITTKNHKEEYLTHPYGPLILLLARLCSAQWNNISDCDETYNYWEPTHFILYGYGFQTWEYSPIYAIRSYAYIWIHALVGSFFNDLTNNKILVFYLIRSFLGLTCAISEYYFYRGICHQFGLAIGRLVLVFLLFGAGMFISSTAYLPSSFSMYMTMISYGALFSQHHKVSIIFTAISTLIGWPFSAVLGIPIAYEVLLRRRKVMFFLKWCIISLFAIMGPIILVDSYYYGHLVISPLNIVLYNVFSEHGSKLYGTESWKYYFINGFLNFNILFCTALFSGSIVLWYHTKSKPTEKKRFAKYWNSLTGMYIWILIFFTQAHKEERFLFPIYPLICLNGTIALHFLQKAVISAFPKKLFYLNVQKWIAVVVVLYIAFSGSRIFVLYKGYSAPLRIFMHLKNTSEYEFDEQVEMHSICMGKEWHRFPSNFFLPANFRMHFIQSDFHGQLPKPFSRLPNATQIIPDGMNDQNLEEGNQYRNVKNCHYLIDSDFPTESLLEPRYSKQTHKWKTVLSVPFLDAKRSSRLFRAFYIPVFSKKRCKFVNYNILQRM